MSVFKIVFCLDALIHRSQQQLKNDRAYVQECSATSAARKCPVVVVDKIMLGAWPNMPTSTLSQSQGRISSQQKFSVVDL